MGCITVPLEESFKKRMEAFPWVNWSELSREESMKKEIFEEYIKTGKLSDENWEFCNSIDWHPVDWLPLNEKFAKELEQRRKGPFIKLNSVEEIFTE